MGKRIITAVVTIGMMLAFNPTLSDFFSDKKNDSVLFTNKVSAKVKLYKKTQKKDRNGRIIQVQQKWFDKKGKLVKSVTKKQYIKIKKKRVASKIETKWYKNKKLTKKEIVDNFTWGKQVGKNKTLYNYKNQKLKNGATRIYTQYLNGKRLGYFKAKYNNKGKVGYETRSFDSKKGKIDTKEIQWSFDNGKVQRIDEYTYKNGLLKNNATYKRSDKYSNNKRKYLYKGKYNNSGKRITTYQEWFNTKGITTKKKEWLEGKYLTSYSTTHSEANYHNNQAGVVSRLNVERKKIGLHPVKVDAKLTKAAKIRAKELVRKYSHTRPDGKEWSSIAQEVGYNRMSGENINMIGGAFSDKFESKTTFLLWWYSPPHKANMMRDSVDEIGVATYEFKGNVYSVMLLGYAN